MFGVCSGVGVVPASVLELLVALGPGEEDVHPDPHGLGRGRHQVVLPVVGLHAERGLRGQGLGGRVVHVHLRDRVEVDPALHFRLQREYYRILYWQDWRIIFATFCTLTDELRSKTACREMINSERD